MIPDNPSQKLFHRRSIRLPGYDYSENGSYFITIISRGRESIFGKVVDEKVLLSTNGQIVWEVWRTLPKKYSQVALDTFVVMPNHFHGIITICDDSKINNTNLNPTVVTLLDEKIASVRAIHELPLPPKEKLPDPNHVEKIADSEENRIERRQMLLPKLIGYFKMQTAKQINLIRNTPGKPLWHRNYYEHIIGSDEEFASISDYIEFNPMKWANGDEYYR